jgi:hypothetical protein
VRGRNGIDKGARKAPAAVLECDDELDDADFVAREVVQDVGGDGTGQRWRRVVP